MFEEWQAAVGSGATLRDLWDWDNGNFSSIFKAKVMAWYEGHQLVESHRTDANISPKRKGKG